MKYINLLFILLFLTSAFLQLNDEDALLWAGIYFSGAVLCAVSIFQKGNSTLFTIALLTYLTYAIVLFFGPDGVWKWWSEHDAENIGQGMKATKPWIENTREFFGLLILSFAQILNLLFRNSRYNENKQTLDQ